MRCPSPCCYYSYDQMTESFYCTHCGEQHTRETLEELKKELDEHASYVRTLLKGLAHAESDKQHL